jgi:hypothetical protein
MGKFPNTVSGLMQLALLTVEMWCNEVGLSVNLDKTGLAAFTRKRKLPGFFEPQFCGVKLSPSGSVKYLRVILDSRLIWREHVDFKMRKARNLLWACRRECGSEVGPAIQCGPLAVRRNRSADHLFCILSMVAWLSDG